MRSLVVAIGCALALSGCGTPQAADTEAGPTPLTAVTAFGDFDTIDYCSLLDIRKVAVGKQVTAPPDSSFESCHVEIIDGTTHRAVTVGPLAFDTDPNLRPYEYPGPVPDGVGVQQSMFNDQNECTRAMTFADGIRLNLTVADTAGKSPADVRCREADAAVGSVFGTIAANRVGRLIFGERSWGRVAPCALLDGHALDGPSGSEGQPNPGLSGHSCIRGKVSLQLSATNADTGGQAESLGGLPVRVTVSGAFCTVATSQPAPGVPGRVEKAVISVVETAGTAGDATCAAARSAAGAIVPRLPRMTTP